MKKFIFTLAAVLIFAANFSMCQAAKVALYNSDAEDMLDEIMDDVENELSEDSFPYVIKNFRSGGDLNEQIKEVFSLPNKNFKGYACDVGFKNSENPEGMIIFIVDDTDKVFSVMIAVGSVDENTPKSRQEELMQMLLMTSALVFHSVMSEEQMEALINNIVNNVDKGSWSIWCDGKYINCQLGKSDDMYISMIDATDGNN